MDHPGWVTWDGCVGPRGALWVEAGAVRSEAEAAASRKPSGLGIVATPSSLVAPRHVPLGSWSGVVGLGVVRVGLDGLGPCIGVVAERGGARPDVAEVTFENERASLVRSQAHSA